MLRRLFRSLGGHEPPTDAPRASYLTSLLAGVNASQRAALESASTLDPLAALGEAILLAEANLGLDDVTNDPAHREQFLRTYAGLLVENDRLPPELQISGDALRKPRRLLSAFFGGVESVQREAQDVLSFIEDRFAGGRFGQARLLLQLFDTDPATRRNNERNLFYEEMILRFMSKRTSRIASTKSSDFQRLVADSMGSTGEGIIALSGWLEQQTGVRLHVLVPHLSEPIPMQGADAAGVRSVAGMAWRPVSELSSSSLADAVVAHVEAQPFRTYVLELTRAAYFVAHAPGTTGYEDLLFRYVEWTGAHFKGPSTRILPDIHRQSTIEDVNLLDALDHAYQAYLSDSPSFGSGAFSREAIEESLGRVHRRFDAFDPQSIPEGDYDLGGILLDDLAQFPSAGLAEAFRVHRLT